MSKIPTWQERWFAHKQAGTDVGNRACMGEEIAELRARIAALEARLEIRPDIPYDGIECRDETIRQYADQICDLKIRLSQQVEVMRQAREALARSTGFAPWLNGPVAVLDAAIKKGEMP
jgi:hypothetical protein